MAQLSNSAYQDEADIKRQGGLPQGWAIFKSTDTNSSTGFVAHAYFNESTKEIVIAYRGSEIDRSMIDWKKADLALAKDGDPDKLLKGTSFEKQIPNAKHAVEKAPNWDAQFTQGLDFADEIIKKYGEKYHISVTGHSLGGSIAQVVSKMHNLPGVTFDPAGAKNIVESSEFKSWALSHNKPESGLGSNNAPSNYIVNNSVVSNYSGAHVGINFPISGIAHQDWKANVSDGWSRHSMPRILSEFKEAYEQHRAVNIIASVNNGIDADIFAAEKKTPQINQPLQLSQTAQTLITDATTHTKQWVSDNNLQWNDQFEQAVHSIAHQAHKEGMTGINLFAVKDGQIHFAHKHGFELNVASVDTKIASNTEISSNLQAMADIDQTRAHSHHHAQEQMLTQTHNRGRSI